MSDALIAPAYAEIARLHRHFRLLNGSPEALEYLLARTPTPTGAELQTWLGVSKNRAAFEQLISAPAGMAAVAASSTAMAAVVASSTAMAAVVASSTAMAAVAANSQAMAAVLANSNAWAAVVANSNAWAAVVASSTAMAAVAASQNALAAIRQSSTAISAINASSQALDILYNAATKFTYAGGWSANPATLVTGNFLLVRVRQITNSYGWGDGASSGQYIRIGGSGWTATNGQSTNNLINRTTLPHVYDNALRPVNNTTIQYYLYNSYEIAYLAA